MILTKLGRTIVSLAFIGPLAIGGRSTDAPLTLQAASRIWVSGTSNVKNFECKAVNPNVTVSASKRDAVRAVTAGEQAVGAVDLRVTVTTMDCGNGTINDHMREALNANTHPVIEFTVASYTLVKSADSVGVTLNGTLNINGTEKTITIDAGAKNAGNDVLEVTGEYDVHMNDYGVSPPTLMLGTMRVGELATVHFDLLLKS